VTTSPSGLDDGDGGARALDDGEAGAPVGGADGGVDGGGALAGEVHPEASDVTHTRTTSVEIRRPIFTATSSTARRSRIRVAVHPSLVDSGGAPCPGVDPGRSPSDGAGPGSADQAHRSGTNRTAEVRLTFPSDCWMDPPTNSTESSWRTTAAPPARTSGSDGKGDHASDVGS